MTDYRLAPRADADLDEIFEYTLERFGLNQARLYLGGLRACFETLAANPRMGRKADAIGTGVRRHEHGSHIFILYEVAEHGVTVLAIVYGGRQTALEL